MGRERQLRVSRTPNGSRAGRAARTQTPPPAELHREARPLPQALGPRGDPGASAPCPETAPQCCRLSPGAGTHEQQPGRPRAGPAAGPREACHPGHHLSPSVPHAHPDVLCAPQDVTCRAVPLPPPPAPRHAERGGPGSDPGGGLPEGPGRADALRGWGLRGQLRNRDPTRPHGATAVGNLVFGVCTRGPWGDGGLGAQVRMDALSPGADRVWHQRGICSHERGWARGVHTVGGLRHPSLHTGTRQAQAAHGFSAPVRALHPAAPCPPSGPPGPRVRVTRGQERGPRTRGTPRPPFGGHGAARVLSPTPRSLRSSRACVRHPQTPPHLGPWQVLAVVRPLCVSGLSQKHTPTSLHTASAGPRCSRARRGGAGPLRDAALPAKLGL